MLPTASTARRSELRSNTNSKRDSLTLGTVLEPDLNFVYTGFRNLRLSLNIRNALLDAAPVDLRGGYAIRPRTIKLAGEYVF